MSLGGKTKETQQIDPDLKAAALANLAMAQRVGQLGFVPYKGATVAGLQPAQIAAMQNTNAGLEAFGLGTSAVPTGGNLSPYGIYQEQLAQMAPGQRAFIESMFINPMTGAMPGMQFGAQAAPATPAQAAAVAAMMREGGGEGRGMTAGGGGRSTTSMATLGSYMPGGVNTNNPGSLGNRVAAAATSKTYGGAPTGGRAAQAPPGRSSSSGKSASTSGASAGGGKSSSGAGGGKSSSGAGGGKSAGGSNEGRR